MRFVLLIATVLSLGFFNPVAAQVSKQDSIVLLGTYRSRVQITYPTTGKAPFPTVLLIHGSTPADMDFTVRDFTGRVVSNIFKDIAEYLPTRGFAVVRYDKRFAGDYANYASVRLQDLLSDARTVLEETRKNPLVDASKTFVYGWSEGSIIAPQLAFADTSLRGVILHGPVAYPFGQTFLTQFERVGVPYLTQFARDGKIDLAGVQAALNGPGGLVARGQAFYLLDPTSPTPKLSALLDQNRDGWIDLQAEALPVFRQFFAEDSPALGMYQRSVALPNLLQIAPRLTMPLLILQGENDANTSADGARVLEAAIPGQNKTVKYYPGLGHSLGPAASVLDDNFRPIARAPLDDLVVWLEAKVK